MILPALLALATGVFPGPRFSTTPRVVVYVKHPGKPREFTMAVRTKDKPEDQWVYYRDIKHMPIRLRTNSNGRRVVVTLPTELKRWTQVCALLPPEREPGQSGVRVFFSLESCSNIP